MTVSGLAGLLLTGLLGPTAAFAAKPSPPGAVGPAAAPARVRPVVPKPLPADTETVTPPPAVAWPQEAEAAVDLTAGRTGPTGPGRFAAVGGLPVQLSLDAGPGVPDSTTERRTTPSVRVKVLDAGKARAAGVSGLLLTVDTGTLGGSPLSVRVDYRSIAGAGGAGWGSRLRLVRLPACVLTTPEVPACQVRTDLASVNDAGAATVTAQLPGTLTEARTGTQTDLPTGAPATQPLEAAPSDTRSPVAAAPAVLAAEPQAAGASGDFKATGLAPSGSWTGGSSAGGFAWTYPVPTPEVFGGPRPDLALSYSSQSVDGRTSVSNNQSNWVGDGWSFAENFVERRYRTCSDDMGGTATNTTRSGDLCWYTDNATLSLNGTTAELVRAADGSWHPVNDTAAKVERLTGAANGDNDGEYWKVTDAKGVQYFFGLNRLPGWTAGKDETNSAWTVPVFGNNPGEDCNKPGNHAASWCQQAWRWNLDHVVDPRGNAMTVYYAKETNNYGRNGNLTTGASTATSYVRGGHPLRMEYGLRADAVYATPAARVDFTVTERCVPDTAARITCAPGELKTDPDPSKDTTRWWPDVPFDLDCADGKECKGQFSPSFWTRKRLTGITTKVLVGGSLKDVDTWTLTQTFPPTGDTAKEFPLWLEAITRTGTAGTGSPITLPPVTFNGIQLPNRVDGTGDGAPPFLRRRVNSITTETGATVAAVYSAQDCTTTDLPAPETNNRRCYPVFWQKPSDAKPTLDWFHKYVVTQVREEDNTGGSPAKVTDYTYLGGPAWTKSTDELAKPEHRTWSEYRGYATVQTRTGAGNDPRTLAETVYLRGIPGAKVVDSEGNTVDDDTAFQGTARETRSYLGDGGPLVSATTNTPWQSGPTATRTRPGLPDLVSRYSGTARTATRTLVDGGTWRRTGTTTTYDAYGMVTAVDDAGDLAVSTDDRCTRTEYARNTAANLLGLPSRVETVATGCANTPVRPRDVVADNRSAYDGGAAGTPPTRGLLTATEQIKGDGSGYAPVTTVGYDLYGRATSMTNAAGATTSTAYTPAQGEAAASSVVTNPLGHTVTSEFDPRRGLTTATVDPNGKRTDSVYDALGRLVRSWSPGWPKAGHESYPSVQYDYRLNAGAPTVVTTKTLMHTGAYQTGYTVLDSFLRARQTQTVTFGGRLITETFYDTHGWTTREFNPYWTTGPPEPRLVTGDPYGVVNQRVTEYDGAGRPTAVVSKYLNQEVTRTTTLYGGDRTTVLPPNGGTATTTITDARGNTTELRQYTNTARTAWTTTSYAYQDRGLLTRMTAPGDNTWHYSYDVRGRRIATVDPDRGTSSTTYDGLDRPVTVTGPTGVTLTTDYDALGRTTAVRNGATTLAAWTFDSIAEGQPTSSTRFVDGQPYTTTITGYDDRYRPTGRRVSVPAAEGRLAGTYSWTYDYDPQTGKPRSTTLPAAGPFAAETLGFGYENLLGLPLSTGGTLPYVQNTTYDNYGSVSGIDSSITGRRVYQRFAYDPHTRRLTDTAVKRDLAPVDLTATHYSYDAVGNVTGIAEQQQAGAGPVLTDTQCYTYDALRRMTEAWTATDRCAGPATTGGPASNVGGPEAYWTSYRFDDSGNRTGETRHGLGVADTVRTYTNAGHRTTGVDETGPAGRRTETYAYDAAGNTARRTATGSGTTFDRTLIWDAQGHLATDKPAGSTDGSGYLYDADGNRLLRKDANLVTLYLGETELTWDKVSTEVLGTRTYTHNGTVVAVRTGKPGGGTTVVFQTTDRQGTATTTIDGANQQVTRRRKTPYGAPRGVQPATWPNDKGFLGKPQDSTGLTHIGAREYDPALGRFLSVDPVMDESSPGQLHGYTYANANPVSFGDPTGLVCVAWENPSDATSPCTHDTGEDGDEPKYQPSQGPRDAPAKPGTKCSSACGKGLESLIARFDNGTDKKGARYNLAVQLRDYVLARTDPGSCEHGSGSRGTVAACSEMWELSGSDRDWTDVLYNWAIGDDSGMVFDGNDTLTTAFAGLDDNVDIMWHVMMTMERDRYARPDIMGGDGSYHDSFFNIGKDLAGMMTGGRVGTEMPKAFFGSYDLVYQLIEGPGGPNSTTTVAFAATNDTSVSSLTHFLPDAPQGQAGATVRQYYFWTATIDMSGRVSVNRGPYAGGG
ncbi:RHS repeat-associated core domain-containing protein [Streptomyces sp. TLI_053]|uniref:RHS repeat domain-containing protein n=1 Tax=Streptomyces sp. TLI_053 TaxID=1855352 RepID=UPI00135209BD|nr:RHS repeat-associated core domain-containing protein [Streptomyces sp. TLI_053]